MTTNLSKALWPTITMLILIVPAIVIATPTNAQVHECHGDEYCDAGDLCEISLDQGTDEAYANYWQDDHDVRMSHVTLHEERWVVTTCSEVDVTVKTVGSSADSKVLKCKEVLCRARAWYDVTFEGDRDLGTTLCTAFEDNVCQDSASGTRKVTKNNINVAVPNTILNSENCGLAEVARKTEIDEPWEPIFTAIHKCGPTEIKIGTLPL